jgi:hypothetical protein
VPSETSSSISSFFFSPAACMLSFDPPCTKATSTFSFGSRSRRRFCSDPMVGRSSTWMPKRLSSAA